MMEQRPDRSEAAEYFFRYIDLVPSGDICEFLVAQGAQFQRFLSSIPDDRSRHRYAPDKWSIRQVLGHVNDTERVFAFRAFWIARGIEEPLPGFDQDVVARHDRADERPWDTLVEEFGSVRSSTVELFRHLPPAAWTRRGHVGGHETTPRALAYQTAGHVIYHVKILEERYLATGAAELLR